jgi:hypothetical protein
MNPATFAIVLVFTAAVSLLPRRYFLAPFVFAACLVPTDQRFIIADLDFTVLRILVVMGLLRLWLRGEIRRIVWNRFDLLVLIWVGTGAVIYSAQWMTLGAVINRCGVLFDVVGMYWLFRQSIRLWEEVVFLCKVLAVGAIVLLPFVVYESTTGHNPFKLLGRANTAVRDNGQFRCAASFPHSIMLGLFWATLVPPFIGLARWSRGRERLFFWAACAAAAVLTWATVSSTPLATLLEVLALLALYRWRRYGRQIMYGLMGLAVCLHLIMNHPVWHLLARVNIIGGSTGYHRFRLVDQAIHHWSEWVLLGSRSTAHWGFGMQDLTNQYVLEGVRGGLITLILFIVLLVTAVRTVCRYSLLGPDPRWRFFVWCLCVSLLGHCLAFLGVSYFGQIQMLLYLTLAMVGLIRETLERQPALAAGPNGHGRIDHHRQLEHLRHPA